MKYQELLSVGIKLFGVYLVFLLIKTIAGSISQYQILNYNGASEPIGFLVIEIFVALIIALFSFLFFKFPKLISKKLLPPEVPDDLHMESEPVVLINISFIVIGIYILSWAIPDLVDNAIWIIYVSNQDYVNQTEMPNAVIALIVTVVEICIGGFLALGSKGLSQTLWKLRG